MLSLTHIQAVAVSALWRDALSCFLGYLCYIVPVAASLVVLHLVARIPREVFRKMLHMAAFTSTPVIMAISRDWRVSVAVLLAFGVVVWPLLALLENRRWYDGLFVQRRTHEVRRSLLILFWGNAALVALCWGWMSAPHVVVASILMWGFGDAAAALIGKRWGRHHTQLPLADPQKTWEGTCAMWAVASVVGTVTLAALGTSAPLSATLAVPTAAMGAYVELITGGGNDTITVPFAHAAALFALLALLG